MAPWVEFGHVILTFILPYIKVSIFEDLDDILEGLHAYMLSQVKHRIRPSESG